MIGESAEDISDISPDEAWRVLESSADTVLVDVRTRPEWQFVGLPDLSALGRSVLTLEWQRYPDMAIERDFAGKLFLEFGDRTPSRLLFICRSGQRSKAAARCVAAAAAGQDRAMECINVAEGFEGDRDHRGRRGSINGWKARGLDWIQS